jgi:hypothetical protein
MVKLALNGINRSIPGKLMGSAVQMETLGQGQAARASELEKRRARLQCFAGLQMQLAIASMPEIRRNPLRS